MAHHDFYFFEPYKCTCLLRLVIKLLLRTQPTFLPWHFVLCQRPSSEEGCSVLLPVLAMIEMWRGKKSVECSMDQTAVHDSERGTTIPEQGRGQLLTKPHVRRPISCHVTSLSWQEPEDELNRLLLMKVSNRDRNVKVKMFGCIEVIVSFCNLFHSYSRFGCSSPLNGNSN